MPVDFLRLCRRLGYRFSNLELLKQALTHRSAHVINNERFEFLGDSILSFVVATALFTYFPDESEGKLSRLRAYLVKGERLAEIALELDLGDYLILGQGELRSGGFRRESILADTLEAIFAAVFLDGGLMPAKELILRLYEDRLQHPDLNASMKDFKTELQELLQAQKKSLPKYVLDYVDGNEHAQIFHVRCLVSGFSDPFKGTGSTRRKAEQEAASLALNSLQKNHDKN